VLLLVAACSSPGEDDADATTTPVPGAPTLRGRVGTEDSADAFEIPLVDEAGTPVTALPAGQYDVEVTDWSDVHDLHLSGGDGAVDEKTGIRGHGQTLWVVTFEPGDHR
jgi:hypothetical protein